MQLLRGPWLATLVFLAFLVPNHYEPWRSFHQEAIAFAAFIPLIWRGMRAAPLDRCVVLGIVIFAISPLIQLWGGQTYFFGDALVHAFYLVFAVIIAIAGYVDRSVHVWRRHELARSKISNPIDYLLAGILLSGIVSVGLLFHQWLDLGLSDLFINAHRRGTRPYANLAQPNHVSLLLALSMVVVWGLWESRRIGAAGAYIAAAWLLSGLVLTDSRAFLLGIAAFFIVIFLLRIRCGLRTSSTALVLILVAFFMMSHAKQFLHHALLLTGTELEGARFESIHSRALIWRLLIEAIFDKPWIGYGWGMVAFAQLKYSSAMPGTGELFFSAHNWLLDLMIFMGIPAAIAVAACGLLWFTKARKEAVDVKSVMVLLVPVLVVAYSSVEFQFAYSYFLLPAAYCAGWSLSSGHEDSRADFSPHEKGYSVVAIAGSLALIVLGVLIVVDYLRFEQVWQRERFIMARIDPTGARPVYEPYVLTNLKGILELERAEPRYALDRLSLESIGGIAARYPYIPFVTKWAWALRASGRPEEGRRLIEAVCAREGRRRCEKIRWSVEGF